MAVKYPLVSLFGLIGLAALSLGLMACQYRQRQRLAPGVAQLKRIKDTARFQRLRRQQSIFKLIRSLSFVGLCVALLFVASRPVSVQTTTRDNKGLDVMMVLDASGSMKEYFQPLGASLKELIGQFKTDRLGLIIFSGEAQQSLPLTDDYTELAEVSTAMATKDPTQFRNEYAYGVAGGTDISSGLYLASIKMANIPAERTKIVLLMSDGEQTTSTKDDPSGTAPIDEEIVVRAANSLAKKNIRVIALATPGDQITYGNERQGRALLERVASATNGKVYDVASPGATREVFNTINTSLRTDLAGDTVTTQYETPWFWLTIAILMLGAFLLSSAMRYDGGSN